MGQPTDEHAKAMLGAKTARRRFVGAGLVALVALAGGGVGLKWLLDSGDGGEPARGGLVDLGKLTATPTIPAPATATSTPEAGAAGQAVQGTHVAEHGCPGVTLDYIAQTGQTERLTAPLSSCVDFQWFAVPILEPWDINNPRHIVSGRIAYTLPYGTDIYLPTDGEIEEIGKAYDGRCVVSIQNGNDYSGLFLFDAELNSNIKKADFLPRGTFVARSGKALPSEFDLDGATVVLGAGPVQGHFYDLSDPQYWVDGTVAVAFLAV